MKKLLLISLLGILYGCFGAVKFDSSSEESIRESTRKITQDWPIERREEFSKAIMYFSLGGEDGVTALLGLAVLENLGVSGENKIRSVSLDVIHGLTGEEIISEYRLRIEEAKIKKESEEAERVLVQTLKNEAQKYLDNGQLELALTTYQKLAEIPDQILAAEIGIEETTKAMSDLTEKLGYVGNIEITEFVARRIDTYSSKNVPAIRISIKNNGERSLDEVKVTFYFRNQSGEIIYEDDYRPVFVSEYSFGGDNEPLKAGQIKEMAEGKYYTLGSPLSEWQDGNATAKVVDFKFSEISEAETFGSSEVGALGQESTTIGGSLSSIFNAKVAYMASCNACHAAGVANAPKLGDKAAWDARMEKGMDAIMVNVMNGINAMPMKGLCMTCTRENLEEIVNYMISYE